MNNKRFINPTESVQNLKGYKNSSHTSVIFGACEDVLKLDSNETHIPPSPHVVKTLTNFIKNKPLNWYPDVESIKLRQKLSEYTNFPIDYIQTFNGSDNALECISRTYIEKGNEAVVCAPSYDHFRVYIESCCGTIKNVYGTSPFVTKPKILVEAVTNQTKIIYIVNPNNPTGILYNASEIEFILNEASDVLLVVDEAYFEFCKTTMSNFIDKYPNFIVTRSFSKAFGLAGVRCGYILTQPKNIEQISKVRIGKNINSLAQVASIAALEDIEYANKYVVEIKESKSWLLNQFQSLNIKTIDTPANYILIQVKNPQKTCESLEEKNIFVRDRSGFPQLEGFLRVTIAPKHLMQRFWSVFKSIPTEYLY